MAGVGASALVFAAATVTSMGRQGAEQPDSAVRASTVIGGRHFRSETTLPAVTAPPTAEAARPAGTGSGATTTVTAAAAIGPEASLVATPPDPGPVVRRTHRPTTPQSSVPVCRNSTDPRCGAFAWDPAPEPNQPLTITLDVSPEQPEAGDEVTVHVVAVDPDAAVTTNGGMYFFRDPYDRGAQIGFAYVVENTPDRFGPWTPPVPTPGRLEMSFSHTFSQPGDFEFLFGVLSGDEADPGNVTRNPYASAGEASVRITVGASPGRAEPS